MGKRERGWDELVQQIEEELSERGPSETDDRKVRFLIAAYLRDIRDQLSTQSSGIKAPRPRSKWDVDVGNKAQPEDDGDTRPFAFIDELRVPVGKGNKDKPPKNDDEKG
jgi:hypothetical protein